MNSLELTDYSILVVDDMLENVAIIVELLCEEYPHVYSAENGEQALAIVQENPVDLILLDIMIPGLDGFEICRRLKANPESRDIPVIFMTALNEAGDKLKGFDAGCVDYMTKPIDQAELLARIKTHLQLRALNQRLQRQNSALLAEIETRKRIEQSLENTACQLEERSRQLQKRNQELDSFARTVAHDLKNPVSSIIGLHGLVRRRARVGEALQEKTLHHINLIGNAAEHAYNIIEALLILARSAYEDVPASVLNMGKIVRSVVTHPLCEMIRKYSGTVEISENLPQAMGYEPWVVIIWLNYLSNALKYGGDPPLLHIGAEATASGRVRFWVEDNGPGLDPEAQAKLFTPFVRLEHERVEGHGLGLAIVRQITEKLGGSVGVESTPGQGSRFYFELPAINFQEKV